MRKYLLPVIAVLFLGFSANAQLDSTKVIDNKGTIKYVLKANNSKILTQKDSLVLYVTPKQLNDLQSNIGSNYVKYADTSAMLANYLNNASSGLTKSGQTVKLGGTLTETATITTTESAVMQIRGLQSGSTSADSVMVVDPANGTLKWISASTLFNALNFGNGLTKTGNNVELGGALSKPTTITTDATNVLKIGGLQSGDASVDSLVVTGADGTLKRVSKETLLQSGDVMAIATAGQTTITVANMPANPSRIWVYRNGAKLLAGVDFSTIAGLVTLTPTADWAVLAGDVIEVQWVK